MGAHVRHCHCHCHFLLFVFPFLVLMLAHHTNHITSLAIDIIRQWRSPSPFSRVGLKLNLIENGLTQGCLFSGTAPWRAKRYDWLDALEAAIIGLGYFLRFSGFSPIALDRIFAPKFENFFAPTFLQNVLEKRDDDMGMIACRRRCSCMYACSPQMHDKTRQAIQPAEFKLASRIVAGSNDVSHKHAATAAASRSRQQQKRKRQPSSSLYTVSPGRERFAQQVMK